MFLKTAYVILPVDLLSAKRIPIIGWMDEVASLSVAYEKMVSHITPEMERRADDTLDRWFPTTAPTPAIAHNPTT